MPILKRYPLRLRFGLFVVLPVCVAALVVYRQLETSTALHNGTLVLPSLQAPVYITFDAHGTPTVSAKSDHDAYFAQGYLHASERMWEMELQRRLVQGRLSEVFGSAAAANDHWMRILGLHQAASEA